CWSRFSPAGLPSLEEALDEIVVRGGRRCVIERKPRDATAQALCELIRALGVRDRVLVSSGAAAGDAWDLLDECRRRLGVRVAYQLAGDAFRDPGELPRGEFVS